MARQIGYARVSTTDQNPQLQVDALTKAGCDEIFVEKITGVSDHKVEFVRAFRACRPGDTLVVWKLDRMSRSVKQLIDILEQLQEKKIFFRSLTEGIDTSSKFGEMVYKLLGVIAEFERHTIRERVNGGIASARARGVKFGRKERLTEAQAAELQRLYDHSQLTVAEIGEKFGIHRTVVYRYISKGGGKDERSGGARDH